MPRGQAAGKDFQVYLQFLPSEVQLKEHDLVTNDASDEAGAGTNLYMECEPDQQFRIVVKDLSPERRSSKRAVCATLYIDGHHIEHRVLYGKHKSWTTSNIELDRGGVVKTYPLIFSAINTVVNRKDAEVDSKQAREIGHILIQLEYGSVVVNRGVAWVAPVLQDTGKVWEEEVKLGSMVMGGQDPIPTRSTGLTCTFQEEDDKYFYSFRIKYATLPVTEREMGIGLPVPIEAETRLSTRRRKRATSTSSSTNRTVDTRSERDKRKSIATPFNDSISESSNSRNSTLRGNSSEPDTDMEKILKKLLKKEKLKKEQQRLERIRREDRKRKRREERARINIGKKNYPIDMTGSGDEEDWRDFPKQAGEGSGQLDGAFKKE